LKSRDCIEENGLLPNSTWSNCTVEHFLEQVGLFVRRSEIFYTFKYTN